MADLKPLLTIAACGGQLLASDRTAEDTGSYGASPTDWDDKTVAVDCMGTDVLCAEADWESFSERAGDEESLFVNCVAKRGCSVVAGCVRKDQ